jgi:hypothetical protein
MVKWLALLVWKVLVTATALFFAATFALSLSWCVSEEIRCRPDPAQKCPEIEMGWLVIYGLVILTGWGLALFGSLAVAAWSGGWRKVLLLAMAWMVLTMLVAASMVTWALPFAVVLAAGWVLLTWYLCRSIQAVAKRPQESGSTD